MLERMNKTKEHLTTIKRRKEANYGHILSNDKYSILKLIVEEKGMKEDKASGERSFLTCEIYASDLTSERLTQLYEWYKTM